MTQERKDLAKSELGMVMGMTYREYHREYQRKYRREKHDKCIAISRAYRQRKAAERGPITAVCAVCGKTFVKAGHYQVCCSSECARLRKNEKERLYRAPRQRKIAKSTVGLRASASTKTCPICGKTFTAKTVRAMFCSKKCSRKFFNGQRKRPTLTKTCPACGKVFETARKEKVYCSNKCYKIAHYTPIKPHDLVCVFCGKPFTSRYATTKYCSQRCASRRNQSGYATLTDFEKAQAERAAAHVRRTERDRNGLTLAQVQEVIDAQDGDPSQLWRRSQSWTAAQRKYARNRYEENHGLFTQTWNP